MVLAGNFDNDSNFELMVPTQNYRELTILEHNENGVNILGEIAFSGKLSINIAVAFYKNNSRAVGVGSSSSALHICTDKLKDMMI